MKEIQSITPSRFVCSTTPQIKKVHANVFSALKPKEALIPCDSFPSIDFKLFAEK